MHKERTLDKIAVVIATKNRPKFLQQRALQSVLKQSLQPYFIIVVDDSDHEFQKDNKTIVESLSLTKGQVHYIPNRRTKGASGAWNTALTFLLTQYSQEKQLFVAFLDDDDEWLPSYLVKCFATAIQNHSHMLCSGFLRHEPNNDKPIRVIPPEALSEDLFLRGNPGIQGSNLFLKLDVILQAGGFDEHLASCTDRDLCIRLCELEYIRYIRIDEPLLNHYADDDRVRLSTPHSESKRNGLNYFWHKYKTRMSNTQQKAFLKRAQSLFHWQPDNTTSVYRNYPVQKILVLGIELTSAIVPLLYDVIEKGLSIDGVTLIGVNVVFVGRDNLTESDTELFIDKLNALGVNSYDLSDLSITAEMATHIFVSENKGFLAWVWKTIDSTTIKKTVIPHSPSLLVQYASPLKQDVLHESIPITLKEKANKCITQSRIKVAKKRIQTYFNINDVELLGIGAESVVMTDGLHVFKNIDYWNVNIPIEQVQLLKTIGVDVKLSSFYTIDEVIIDGYIILITYPFEKSTPYQGGDFPSIIKLIHDCHLAGIVCNNFHPQNIIKTKDAVKFIDYGADIRPWNVLGFEHMARRAYLSIYYADHSHLKKLMKQSIHSLHFDEMNEYGNFRKKLIGIDCLPNQGKHKLLDIEKPAETSVFTLIVGVISGDPEKLLPLLNSLSNLSKYSYLQNVISVVVCNGCSPHSLEELLETAIKPVGNITIISEEQQRIDAENGLFGCDLNVRPKGIISIAHARCLLQKYVGYACLRVNNAFSWILDDDMRVDSRAKQFLQWLPTYKKAGIDVLIGQYEGTSPNPPLNGLRGQLVDLVHNLRWLDSLPDNVALPSRCDENAKLRRQYPDYYYDLSRKHTAHLELPFWIEPEYDGETIHEARTRLFSCAPLLITGFPLTRAIITENFHKNPLAVAKDSVNRGGNTFVLNPKALLECPNLMPKINGHEVRRSDMIWAMINKYHFGLTVKTAPFPVLHTGRIQAEKTLNLEKVKDEIFGSALYAGLQAFLAKNPKHDLNFTEAESIWICKQTQMASNERLVNLKLSFYRINGLAHALSKYPELTTLCEYINTSFNMNNYNQLKSDIEGLEKKIIEDFLCKLVSKVVNFTASQTE